MRLTLKPILFLCLPIMVVWSLATIAEEHVDTEAETLPAHDASVCSPDGVALGGHDVVAYHLEEAAVLGDVQYQTEWDGLVYHFKNAENLVLFEQEPEQYLPHFQGWCAIALARNRLTCPDYENFKIEDGKLLLFETIAFVNGRNLWDSNPIKNLISAEQNFERILQQ